jgi:hypothetical protein
VRTCCQPCGWVVPSCESIECQRTPILYGSSANICSHQLHSRACIVYHRSAFTHSSQPALSNCREQAGRVCAWEHSREDRFTFGVSFYAQRHPTTHTRWVREPTAQYDGWMDLRCAEVKGYRELGFSFIERANCAGCMTPRTQLIFFIFTCLTLFHGLGCKFLNKTCGIFFSNINSGEFCSGLFVV